MRHALVKLRLPGHYVERRLAVECQPVHAGLDIHDACDMLLRMDDVAGRLHEANDPDVDIASGQTVESARIECLESGTAGERLGVRTISGRRRACG